MTGWTRSFQVFEDRSADRHVVDTSLYPVGKYDRPTDLVTREVTCGGRAVELQPREFSLLAFLLRHAGRPLSKTMILEHVWDYSFDPQTNVVDVVVSRLRTKIDLDHKRIETIRSVGYIFRPRV